MTSLLSKPHPFHIICFIFFFLLDFSFSACLESSLTFELFQEMEQFEQVYERLRGNAEAVDMIHDAAISLVNQDCLQLDGNSALRGSVAGVLEKVISGRDMVNISTNTIQHLFLLAPPFFRYRVTPSCHTLSLSRVVIGRGRSRRELAKTSLHHRS